MPNWSDDFIEEVRSRNDIVDVISGYVKLTRKGSNYFGLCPFHGEKTPSFSVSSPKQMYYCFGCGAGGNVFSFMMNYENFTFPEAVEYLAERAGMEVPKQELSQEAKRAQNQKNLLLEIQKDAANYFYMRRKGKGGETARSYLEKRGLSEETIRKFALGYAPPYRDDLYRYLKQKGYQDQDLSESGLVRFDEKYGAGDKFWNRVMFPIQDAGGHVIGFGGRVMGDGEPKYLNSPETKIFDKSRNLYGLNLARTTRLPYLILCEGYMDVISLHQAGFTNAVASLGTSLTQGHARLLARYTKQVYLCYDSDGAGVKAILRALPILRSAGIATKVIHMDPYKDPDEFIKALGDEAYQERIDQAQNSFLFEIDNLEKNSDLSDPAGKSDFLHEMAKRLTRFEDEIERNSYMETLSKTYGVEYESLRRLVNTYGLNTPVIERPEEIQAPRKPKVQKTDEGIFKSQRLLLTWLSEHADQYSVIKKYIRPTDLEGTLFQEVAKTFFEQLEEGRANPASLISMYADEETQSQVAAMFQTDLLMQMSPEDLEKTIRETIRKIKELSIKRSSEADSIDINQMIEDKKALSQLSRLQFR